MKESKFQLIGKPIINNFSYETNKDYKFNGDLALEVDSNIHVIKGIEEHSREAIVALKIGIFTLLSLIHI